MAKVDLNKVKKYAKACGYSTIPIIMVVFVYMALIGNIQITGYSKDSICEGSEYNPCLAYVNFTVVKAFTVQTNDTSLFKADKIKEVKAYMLKSGKWTEMNFTKGVTFSKGKNYSLMFKGYKNLPTDNIKWGFGTIDPYWYGTNICNESYKNFSVSIDPCVQYGIYNKETDMDFTWKGSNTSLDFYFSFPQRLTNKTKVSLYVPKQVNTTYEVSNFVPNVINISTTTKNCSIGTGSIKRLVFYSFNSTVSNVFCFNRYTNVSNNYTIYWNMTRSDWKEDLIDITGMFKYKGFKQDINEEYKYWYAVDNINFTTNQSYKIKFDYMLSKNKVKQGKWGVFVKPNNLNLAQAISSNNYIYIDPYWNSTGGVVTYDGAYTVVTFTSNGTFEWTGDTIYDASVLVVAGGGGGGAWPGVGNAAGGGGAGGIIYNDTVTLEEGNYTVIVGTGGAGGTGLGETGQNSSFGTTMIGWGGGSGGGGGNWWEYQSVGMDGGSGGGSRGYGGGGGLTIQDSIGGTGYGYNGGAWQGEPANCKGGGGGGTSQVGENPEAQNCAGGKAGAGGNGTTFNIYNGTNLYYAGGGGGGAGSLCIAGIGGLGGGGDGVISVNGTSGTANTGGGGGGSGDLIGGNGGSGIVIIRYLTYSAPVETWWNDAWLNRKEMDLKSVSATNLTDYPYAVIVDTETLISEGKMLSDCNDTRFVDDTGSETPFEIESGCNTTNTTIWVLVPNLNTDNSTKVWMYYNNPVATDGQNPDDLWVNYEMVLHLSENSSSDNQTYDSSLNENDWQDCATNPNCYGSSNTSSLASSGKFGNGFNFADSYKITRFSTITGLDSCMQNECTIQYWYKDNDAGWSEGGLNSGYAQWLYYQEGGGTTNLLIHEYGSTAGHAPYCNQFKICRRQTSGNIFNYFNSAETPPIFTTNWYLSSTAHSVSDNVTYFYSNDTMKYSNAGAGAWDGTTYSIANIGLGANGIMDEVRIANFNTSGDWIKEDYGQGTLILYTVGSEENNTNTIIINDTNPPDNAYWNYTDDVVVTQFNASLYPQGAVSIDNATLYLWFSNGTAFVEDTTDLDNDTAISVNWNVTMDAGDAYKWKITACTNTSACKTAGNYTFNLGWVIINNSADMSWVFYPYKIPQYNVSADNQTNETGLVNITNKNVNYNITIIASQNSTNTSILYHLSYNNNSGMGKIMNITNQSIVSDVNTTERYVWVWVDVLDWTNPPIDVGVYWER